jgi:hypothetical protein
VGPDRVKSISKQLPPFESSSDRQRSENTKVWVSDAQPVLQKISARFGTMKWTESGTANADSFEADLKSLISQLAPLPELIDIDRSRLALDHYLKRTIHHGKPHSRRL